MGRDFTLDDLFEQEYKAVFLAVGAQKSRTMGIPGEHLDGVHHGIQFLMDVSRGRNVKLGKKVAVIGGGNVVIDSARSAVRLGAEEVTVVYRRRREDMTALEEEINEARREGVEFHFLTVPIEILGEDGKVVKVRRIKMEPGEFDRSGRRRPMPVENSEFTIDIDSVIMAIGQTTDLSYLATEDPLAITREGTLFVNRDTLQTSREGVFAGGDVVRGPSTVIEAIADGINVAVAIDKYLGGKGELAEIVREQARIEEIPFDLEAEVVEQKRVNVALLPPEERLQNFEEIELGYSLEDAVEEAKRCLHCDRKLVE